MLHYHYEWLISFLLYFYLKHINSLSLILAWSKYIFVLVMTVSQSGKQAAQQNYLREF